jgi:hypothetical protein
MIALFKGASEARTAVLVVVAGALAYAVMLRGVPVWLSPIGNWSYSETLMAYGILLAIALLQKPLDMLATVLARKIFGGSSAELEREQALHRYQRLWMVAVGIAIHAGYTFGPGLLRAYGTSLPLFWFRTTVAVAALVIGWGAHYFKLRNQQHYGTVEIIFGAVSAFKVVETLDPRELVLSQWAALVGAVYIIARGLGNRQDAGAKARRSKGLVVEVIEADA